MTTMPLLLPLPLLLLKRMISVFVPSCVIARVSQAFFFLSLNFTIVS